LTSVESIRKLSRRVHTSQQAITMSRDDHAPVLRHGDVTQLLHDDRVYRWAWPDV